MQQMMIDRRKAAAITRTIRKQCLHDRLLDANALNARLREGRIRLPEREGEEIREVWIQHAYVNEQEMICIMIVILIGDSPSTYRWLPDGTELSALFSRLGLSLRSSL